MLVGLLAMAEGRSTDRNMLREADRDDVLEQIEHETLDRIAHRLYADDQEHLSAYERLLKDDKRKKMDYLNNIRPDLIEREQLHLAEEHEHEAELHEPARHPEKDHVQDRVRHAAANEAMPTTGQLADALRRTEQTHEKLSKRRELAEDERQYSLQERELANERRKKHRDTTAREKVPAHHPPSSFYNTMPETTRSPVPGGGH